MQVLKYNTLAEAEATISALNTALGYPIPGTKPDGTLTLEGEPGWTTSASEAIALADGTFLVPVSHLPLDVLTGYTTVDIDPSTIKRLDPGPALA